MNSTVPEADVQQPPLRPLNRAVLFAAGAAAVIVATIILPAEYGVDVTGVGRIFGLTQMGEMKAAQAHGAGTPAGPVAGDSVTTAPDGTRRVQIVIGPYGGREVKAVMKAGAEMRYEWSTDGQPVEYEFHGDPDNPKTPGEYSSYEKGSKVNATGAFRAAFSGRHGWFWKNLSPKPVVVTATVRGTVEKFAPLYAAGESAATTSVVTASGAQAAADATPYYTMPLKQLMNDVLGHAAQKIWDRQGYISDASGMRSLFPKNDQEWKDAENDALALAEMTNLLLIPGRRVEEQGWTDAVVRVRQSALKLAVLARKKNANAYMDAGVELNDACYACHKKYAPGVE